MKYLISFLLLTGVALADEPIENLTTKATVKEVYDGDTIVVTVTREYRIRMLDCWAPEVKTRNIEEKEKGIASRDFLRNLLQQGDEVLVQIPLTSRFGDSMTFGRVLAYVWKDIDQDGKLDNISEIMVRDGHATKEKNERN